MKQAMMFSASVLALAGCANAPEVSYTLYDMNAQGPQAQAAGPGGQLAQRIVGSEPGEGAIKYSPTGSYVLIAVPAPKPASGSKETPCDGGKPASGSDAAAGVRAACNAVAAALEPGAGKTPITSAKELETKKATLTATPGASSQYLVAITPTERFYFKPNISATFESGTSRLTQLGADSQDTTTQVISSAFGAFTSLAPILGIMGADQPAQTLSLPYVLDLTHVDVEDCISSIEISDDTTKWCKFDTKLSQWEYRLRLKSKRVGKPFYRDAKPGDAAGFFTGSGAPTNTREFPFAPCIRVALYIRNATAPQDEFTSDLTIGDPTRVDTYLIPAKGSITIDGVCGANLKPATYTGTNVLDVVKALADGVNQLKAKQGAATNTAASTKK